MLGSRNAMRTRTGLDLCHYRQVHAVSDKVEKMLVEQSKEHFTRCTETCRQNLGIGDDHVFARIIFVVLESFGQ